MEFAVPRAEATLVSVVGAKGGVGKTTSAINLAASLTGAETRVLVVEADLATANLLDFLDVAVDVDREPTLLDVLADGRSPSTAVYDAPGGFDVVPAGFDIQRYAEVDPAEFPAVVAALADGYDVVVIDVGAGVSYETVVPLSMAELTVLVSSPRVASVRDMEKTKRIVDRVGGTVAGGLFVRAGTGSAPPPARIAEYVDVRLLGHVPEDETVPAAQDAGEPVVLYDETAPATDAYRKAAAALRRPAGGRSATGDPDGEEPLPDSPQA
ncbi:MAG: MinD/ParA family protein [Halolamina sp.]